MEFERNEDGTLKLDANGNPIPKNVNANAAEEAQKQNKTHKIIIMIEMGDLREGVLGEDLLHFYKEIFKNFVHRR